MALTVVPLGRTAVNDFIDAHHRHHKRVQGGKFFFGAEQDGQLVGVCVVGRPVARLSDDGFTAEVTRLCSTGERNVCSLLYGAAARAAKAIGYRKIQTYVLEEEHGVSLKASGWMSEAETAGGSWNRPSRGGRREDQPLGRKRRWARSL